MRHGTPPSPRRSAAVIAAAVLLPAAASPGGPGTFDHSTFDAVLREQVDAQGRVDYAALARRPEQLDAYIASLDTAPLDKLGRDERLALLINAYNAFTLRLILDHYPVKSIMAIPEARRWDDRRWKVAGNVWSLNQIEHEQIRPVFKEPRIHFALVCAARGCPKLRREAYAGPKLNEQLEDQTLDVHRGDRWLRFDEDSRAVYLTKLYDWYGGDFTQAAGSVIEYAARYAPAVRRALERGEVLEIRWLDYSWDLNAQP